MGLRLAHSAATRVTVRVRRFLPGRTPKLGTAACMGHLATDWKEKVHKKQLEYFADSLWAFCCPSWPDSVKVCWYIFYVANRNIKWENPATERSMRPAVRRVLREKVNSLQVAGCGSGSRVWFFFSVLRACCKSKIHCVYPIWTTETEWTRMTSLFVPTWIFIRRDQAHQMGIRIPFRLTAATGMAWNTINGTENTIPRIKFWDEIWLVPIRFLIV